MGYLELGQVGHLQLQALEDHVLRTLAECPGLLLHGN